MDKDEMMLRERDKYIRSAMSCDRDWATQNDPQEVLYRLGWAVLSKDFVLANCIVMNAIIAAADSHVQQMDNLGRFDDVDIIAELRGMRGDMRDLHDSIRGCK